MSALLSYLISETRKCALTSALIPAPLELPPLYANSRMRGEFTIVRETGNPAAPVEAIEDITGGSVAIRVNGHTYVSATGFTYEGNKMRFQLVIVDDNLDVLLAAAPQGCLQAVIEVRVKTADQEDTVLRENVPLFAVDDTIPDAPATLTFTDSSTIHWSLVA